MGRRASLWSNFTFALSSLQKKSKSVRLRLHLLCSTLFKSIISQWNFLFFWTGHNALHLTKAKGKAELKEPQSIILPPPCLIMVLGFLGDAVLFLSPKCAKTFV